MTSAFLQSEAALAAVDPLVPPAAELSRPAVRADWHALREQHTRLTDEYLRLSAASTPGETGADGRPLQPPRADEIDHCTEALTGIASAMETFAQAHAAELARARATIDEVTRLEAQAHAAAAAASNTVAHTPDRFRRLGLVTRAGDELQAALGAFPAPGGWLARRSAATAVIDAAGRVDAAITRAPGLTEEARRVIRSVDTFRAGISTRAGHVPATLSALRREFSVECSADLDDTESVTRRRLQAADTHLADARIHLADAPDQAIADAGLARAELDGASAAVDAVTTRLTRLREVRADPGVVEQRVRFRLRDAQHFAVNHALVDEWGSVLDAQADRILRARDALDRVHPDYWAYLTGLRAVDQRLIEIVDRMRGQVAR
ncbi:MAG: hypothetical protein QM662_15010 [Gordonia sp. (in: high G+C Gram-positive bacteria)]